MSVSERFDDILSLLTEGTQKGTLMWEDMAKKEGWYAGSGSYIYTLRVRVIPDEGPTWISLRVLDKDGNEIDSADANEDDAGFKRLYELLNIALEQIEARRSRRLEGVRAELRSKLQKT